MSVELMKSFCMPVKLYGLQAMDLNKLTHTMINLTNRAVYKITGHVFDAKSTSEIT